LHFTIGGAGEGAVFAFQRGLGGDTNQTFDFFTPPGVRLITLNCHAHGATRPVGDVTKLRFDAFADDVAALGKFGAENT
jgi:hypothetical protein